MKTMSVSKTEFDEYKAMYLNGGVSISDDYHICITMDGTRYFVVDGQHRHFDSVDAFVRAAIIVVKTAQNNKQVECNGTVE